MPRYFFDLHDDVDVQDAEGDVFPDLEAAKAHAQTETRLIVCASIEENGTVDLRHCIRDRDETGAFVAEVRFEDAVRFVRAGDPV